MKQKYLACLFFFIASFANAQLYVSNNASTYVYVNDTYVYAKGNVELNGANSSIYLRKDGQLLQGTTSTSTNIGLGALSVFQEGSVNNFQYNYWCSPVGGSLAVAGNSPFGITQLGVPTTVTATTPATILAPAGGANLNGVSGAGSLSIASYWIWKYTTSTAYSQWTAVANASNINAGEGFTMKGTSGSDATVPFTGAGTNNPGNAQRYDFRGKPNDGTINIAVTNGTQTLTGNPYPSTLDMNLFLTDPTNTALCDGNALYWEHDKSVNTHLIAQYRGGYGIYNGSSGVYTPATFYTYDAAGNQGPVSSTPLNSYQRRFAPIGQGFMIRGIGNGNVQIKNSHRVYIKEGAANNSQFERMGKSPLNTNTDSKFYEPIPNLAGIDYTKVSNRPAAHIKINASLNEQAVRQIALVFMQNAVEGYDRADAKSPDVGAKLPYDMYLYLDNTEYVQSANKFDVNNKYSLGFKNETDATFRMQVADLFDVEGIDNVYLHDKVNNKYHDIKNSEYKLNLTKGVNNNQYEITFVNKEFNSTNLSDNFNVFQNNDGNMLTIRNPFHVDLESCMLYDITGKEVLSKKELGKNYQFEYSTLNFAQGVYIVKLYTKAGEEVTKKIEISNNR